MADRIVVAVDAMGGDNAPEMIVEGLDIVSLVYILQMYTEYVGA